MYDRVSLSEELLANPVLIPMKECSLTIIASHRNWNGTRRNGILNHRQVWEATLLRMTDHCSPTPLCLMMQRSLSTDTCRHGNIHHRSRLSEALYTFRLYNLCGHIMLQHSSSTLYLYSEYHVILMAFRQTHFS